ncbi:MAG: hypothetical protein A2Y70_02050 [Candidatus Aminicenantes bacterium RBG_13_64_14]|nr:MAG: hypothetical protein A2Y70_02050 [Candidatus Aminicenantes bacterium RBG_13_64_14]
MRKIFLAITGAVIALFGLFGVQVGLVGDVNEVGIIAGLLIIGVWIFTEFKRDFANFKQGIAQTNKWGDPAFWTAAITSVLIPVLTSFGVDVSDALVAIVASALAVIVPILFKARKTTV